MHNKPIVPLEPLLATDPTDGRVHMWRPVGGDFKLPKITDTQTASVTKGANVTTASTTVVHNLGYIPRVEGTVYDGTSYSPLPYLGVQLTGATSGLINVHANAKPNATSVVFTIETPDAGSLYTSALTYTFRYYLYKQTAN